MSVQTLHTASADFTFQTFPLRREPRALYSGIHSRRAGLLWQTDPHGRFATAFPLAPQKAAARFPSGNRGNAPNPAPPTCRQSKFRVMSPISAKAMRAPGCRHCRPAKLSGGSASPCARRARGCSSDHSRSTRRCNRQSPAPARSRPQNPSRCTPSPSSRRTPGSACPRSA